MWLPPYMEVIKSQVPQDHMWGVGVGMGGGGGGRLCRSPGDT